MMKKIKPFDTRPKRRTIDFKSTRDEYIDLYCDIRFLIWELYEQERIERKSEEEIIEDFAPIFFNTLYRFAVANGRVRRSIAISISAGGRFKGLSCPISIEDEFDWLFHTNIKDYDVIWEKLDHHLLNSAFRRNFVARYEELEKLGCGSKTEIFDRVAAMLKRPSETLH